MESRLKVESEIDKYLELDEDPNPTELIDEYLGLGEIGGGETKTDPIDEYLGLGDSGTKTKETKSLIDEYLGLGEGETKTNPIDEYLGLGTQEESGIGKIDNYLKSTEIDEIETKLNKVLNSKLGQKEKTKKLIKVIKKEVDLGKVDVWSRVSKYLKNNWKSILFNAATGAGFTALVVVGYAYSAGSSWSLFLNSLKYFGVSVLPGILTQALKSAGISVVTSLSVSGLLKLAKTNKKVSGILEKKVDSKYLKSILSRFGVDDPNQQTREGLMKVLTQQAISLGTLGASGVLGLGYYAITTGVSTGLISDIVKKTKEKITEKLKRKKVVLETKVLETKVLETKVPETKIPNEVTEMADDLVAENEVLKNIVDVNILNSKKENLYETLDANIKRNDPNPTTLDNKLRGAKTSKTNSSLLETIKKNKNIAYTVSFSLISVILAATVNPTTIAEFMKSYIGEVVGLKKVGELLLSSSKVLDNHPIATTTLVNLILKQVGIDKLINLFGGTPEKDRRLRSLRSLIRREKSKSRLYELSKKFMANLTGGKFYNLSQLSKMNLVKLRRIYRRRYPKDKKYKLRTKKDVVMLIKKSVDGNFFKLTELVSGFSKQLITGIISGIATKGLSVSLKKLRRLGKIESKKILDQGLRLEKIDESEKINEIKLKNIEEGLKKRAESIRVGRVDLEKQRLKDLDLKAQFLARKRQIQLEKGKVLEIMRKARLAKLEFIKKADELKKAAFEVDLGQKMDIAVTDAKGLVRPLPPEESYMPKELKEKLDYQFTPLFEQLEEYLVNGAVDYIPVVGWVNKFVRTSNVGLQIGEKIKDVSKINYILTQLDKGETNIDLSKYDMSDFILKQRLPTIQNLVKNIYKVDTVSMADLVTSKIRDGLLEGWDKSKVAYEIGKGMLGKAKSFQMIDKLGQIVKGDNSFKVTNEIGEYLWKMASDSLEEERKIN